MKIAYARVSTRDQNLELQIEALQKYGCEQLFHEKQSTVKDRPELKKMLNMLRPGDVVIVWKLDRLGRSLRHLVDLMELFKTKEVNFKDIADSQLKNIKAPVLIINGDSDVVLIEHAFKMHKIMPKARLAIIPGGHGKYIGEICSPIPNSKMPLLVTLMIEESLSQ